MTGCTATHYTVYGRVSLMDEPPPVEAASVDGGDLDHECRRAGRRSLRYPDLGKSLISIELERS